jgi:hypothetical protein
MLCNVIGHNIATLTYQVPVVVRSGTLTTAKKAPPTFLNNPPPPATGAESSSSSSTSPVAVVVPGSTLDTKTARDGTATPPNHS